MEVKLSRWYRDKGDYVSYTAVGRDGRHLHVRADACYHSIIQHLGEHKIICRPYDGKNSAPPLSFQRFFRALTRHGLVPKGVEIGSGRRNSITVPRRGWGYHPVFISLSLYRHADCHGASLLGQTMKLYDSLREDGVHFLQCFHWALVHTKHGTWHSCFALSDTPYEGAHDRNRNLKYGIGIAAYGQLTLTQKNALKGRSSADMFNQLGNEFQDIRIEKRDDILDPQYAKFYKNPELARK